MKRKILLTATLLALMTFIVPADSYAAGDQQGKIKNYERSRVDQNRGSWRVDRRGMRRNNRRVRNTHGYRNYGQYRRTQVGNRRFRTTRQYYWRNGTRLSRYTRVYY